jgi:hypothetical protein
MEQTLLRAFIVAHPEESVEIENTKSILLDRDARVYKGTHLRSAKLILSESKFDVVVFMPHIEHKVIGWLLRGLAYKPYVIRISSDKETYDSYRCLVDEQVPTLSFCKSFSH